MLDGKFSRYLTNFNTLYEACKGNLQCGDGGKAEEAQLSYPKVNFWLVSVGHSPLESVFPNLLSYVLTFMHFDLWKNHFCFVCNTVRYIA